MSDYEHGPRSGVPAWRTIVATGLLALSFAFSYMDRQILPLLFESVRHAFSMSDTQIGMLQGLAFSSFYAFAGIPLGWLVDRYHRVRIAAACVAVWGMATAACGLSGSFGQFFVARTGTAMGEAGCSPAAYSILSDMLSGRALLRATSVYNTGPYVGGGMALILGSVALRHFTDTGGIALPMAGHFAPWQAVFIVLGLPGLILSALLLLIREPKRREVGGHENDISTRATLKMLSGSSQLVFYYAGWVFISSGLFVLLTWFPSVMIREGFGTASTIGRPLGVMFLVVGLSGCFLSQLLLRNLNNRDLLSPLLRRLSIVLAMQIPLIAAFMHVDTPTAAYWFYACEVAVFSVATTFMVTPIQLVVPNRMRGRATGVFLMSNYMIGASLGPAAVGALSDRMAGDPHGLLTAFVTVLGVSCVGAVILMYLSSTRRLGAKEPCPAHADADAVAKQS
ncbi:MFS transporter [Paraburkholderia unamae]|uniref:Sugar phosphate permease n=1 Tax=Paraburkholderia unamae TaxID=219649 RepID=A0ABX5KHE3_9BURK|nr:MFS transporter [Paraburkholderia unamae]PVX75150.1 sugar phosphate permease [Paraburkholderia unamae]RAR57527.1 sugar phosphate permease [Paraburkholderia unamae]